MEHEEREHSKELHTEHEHHHEDCCCHERHHEDECCHDHGDKHEECHCHEHNHEHEDVHEEHKDIKPTKGMTRKVYILENLGCANCAAKMERKIKELPEVSDASISFPTRQLYVISKNDSDSLIPQLEAICKSIEDEVHIVPKDKRSTKYTADEHNHKHECHDCGHEHGEHDVHHDHCHHEEHSENKSFLKREIGQLILLIIGAVLFIGVEIYHEVSGKEDMGIWLILLLVAAYLILGHKVLLTAFKNILKGKIFDENFLMSIATLGAFAIQEYPEAVGVMLFYRVGELFEEIAVEKSRSRIMEAIDLRPETAILVTGNETKSVPAEVVKIGDIILVRPGDRIPVDGSLVEGESRIDTSAMTGEPVPVTVNIGSEVVSGCVNLSGTIKIKAQKELADSMVSRILEAVEDAVAGKPKIDKFITKFSRVYTPLVVGIALFTAFIIPLITGQEFYPWIYTALTFLVMSCPCALVLSVPLAFFCGIGSASQKGILFKGGVVMEALGKIKAVVFDKTGTITEGNFKVQKINCVGDMTEDELLNIAAACEKTSTHPIAASIVAAHKALFDNSIFADKKALAVSGVEEIAGKGIKAVLNKKDIVLCGNRKLLEDNNIAITDEDRTVGTKVYVALGGNYIGNIVISDTIKSGAKESIAEIKSFGVRTAMLTGDTKENADEVAAQTGIDEIHAKLLPQDKLTNLQKLRENCGGVMFVGDGINDAPVLAGADVGAAMGSGSDAAIEAADVVFLNSNLNSVAEAFRIAKRTTGIAMQNVIFALVIKAVVMILGLTGIYSNMWLAVFADTGVAFLCILNSIRMLLKTK
ncbi:MAG: heavy metal translocating P-type ATPase [Lachnospiraceae bacterium]|nr:heavy metal translocating P-type ATPase [Lachnospiraceae bacterium]